MPAASVKVFAATSMIPAVPVVVKVAVYTVLLLEVKLLNVPPVTLTSPTTKSVVASLVVKVTFSVKLLVEPPFNTATLPFFTVIPTVGGVVSTINALFAPSEPVPPGEGKVKIATLLAASNILPPLSVKELVET